jgi:hypothetical protein
LRRLIGRGLARTRTLWPDIRRAYAWVHRAAHILGNGRGEDAGMVRRRLDGLGAADWQLRRAAARWRRTSHRSSV